MEGELLALNTHWLWPILAGLVFVLELLTGTIYLLFIALAMLLTTGASLLGLSLTWQLACFALLSVLGVFVFRWFGIHRTGKEMPSRDANVNFDIGATVYVVHWEATGQTTVQYRGAQWQARLEDSQLPATGGPHRIVAIEGLVLVLSPQTT